MYWVRKPTMRASGGLKCAAATSADAGKRAFLRVASTRRAPSACARALFACLSLALVACRVRSLAAGQKSLPPPRSLAAAAARSFLSVERSKKRFEIAVVCSKKQAIYFLIATYRRPTLNANHHANLAPTMKRAAAARIVARELATIAEAPPGEQSCKQTVSRLWRSPPRSRRRCTRKIARCDRNNRCKKPRLFSPALFSDRSGSPEDAAPHSCGKRGKNSHRRDNFSFFHLNKFWHLLHNANFPTLRTYLEDARRVALITVDNCRQVRAVARLCVAGIAAQTSARVDNHDGERECERADDGKSNVDGHFCDKLRWPVSGTSIACK